jgi:Major tropism determinant N-terminal domain
MSLQIRRGTELQRASLSFTPAEGEIIWTTDNNQLWIGDGGTPGGINILANSAGTSMTWNATTQKFDFSGTLSGFNTDDLIDTTSTVNKYYNKLTAQNDIASMFTAVGSPIVTGDVTATVAPDKATVSSVTGLAKLEPFIITGPAGNGLSATTYYIVDIVDSGHITLATSLSNAQNGIAISSISTGSLVNTHFTAGGPDANIAFVYNPATHTISANVTLDGVGIASLSADPSPLLGANLGLNGYNITGLGNVDITGTLKASVGLGGDLSLNNHSITGNGSVVGTTIQAGTTTTNGDFVVFNSTNLALGTFNSITQGTDAAYIDINISRGTFTSPQNIQANDLLSGLLIHTWTGSQYARSIALVGVADGNVINGETPSSFVILTKNTTGTDDNQLRFNSYGQLLLPDGSATHPSISFATDGSLDTGFFHPADGVTAVTTNGVETSRFDSGGFRTTGFSKVGSFAGSGAYPSPAEAGMIIFDSNTNHFYGYNGSTWKQLDN